jgi:hypothetical protein
MKAKPIERWSALAPIVMSLTALTMVLCAVAKYGLGPHQKHDETGADHLFILLMYLQLPIIAAFVYSGRRELKQLLPVLASQLALWAITAGAAVYLT